jgi:signal transduction histidine kinase/ActR/RegA family two-component response regulator
VTRAKSKFYLHRSVVAVVVVGLAASAAGFLYSSSSVRRNDEVLLKQEAGQASVVLGSFLEQYQQGFTALGAAAASGSGDAFLNAAGAVAKASDGSRIALVRVGATTLQVVASTAPLHRAFGGPSDAPIAASLADGKVHYIGITGGEGKRWIETIAGAPYAPKGDAVYWELPTASVVSLSSIPGLPFSHVQAAVYLGQETPGDLWFGSTATLPIRGTRAVVPVTDLTTGFPAARITSTVGSVADPGRLLLVMAESSPLSGTSAALFPWALLIVGLAATTAVAIMLAVALRRRDEALGLLIEMQGKNEELDRALQRQALAEDSLRQAQRLEAVGQLAGGIAHDFNNLLHVILSYADFLEKDLPLNSAMRPDVAEIQSAARRAAELTRQLLVFARGEVVRPQVLDANDVVGDMELLLKHTLGESVALRVGRSPRPCRFTADVGEMKQVLTNLAINSRDAMPRGGELAIEVRLVELKHQGARAVGLPEGSYVRIDVTDTGEGMTREVAARAFEPFFTTKETGRGTGLGLAMVYGIVARWHGFVSISSTPGKGTTVTMLFPQTTEGAEPREPAATPAVPAPQSPRPSSAKRVLLVEDEEQVRRSTARILEAAGYHVFQAGDALEAQQVFAAEDVDLMVTDIVMPGGISGKELADELWQRRPNLPVVFASGYGVERAAGAGVLSATSTLIEKPFTADTLLRTVEEVLGDGVASRS